MEPDGHEIYGFKLCCFCKIIFKNTHHFRIGARSGLLQKCDCRRRKKMVDVCFLLTSTSVYVCVCVCGGGGVHQMPLMSFNFLAPSLILFHLLKY